MSEKSIAEYRQKSLEVACRQVKRKIAANLAICDDCGAVITVHGYWSLDSSVWLHLNGSGVGHRVRYYEYYFA